MYFFVYDGILSALYKCFQVVELGGSHIDRVYVYVRAFWDEIWYSDRRVSSEMKEPKLHRLGVFWANYCKKHPIWSKLGAFLSKMIY